MYPLFDASQFREGRDLVLLDLNQSLTPRSVPARSYMPSTPRMMISSATDGFAGCTC